MCSAIGAHRVELDCSVLEEDWQRGQSYIAHWHSLTFIPQPHHSLTMEAERSARHWEARRLLQRFLSGAISKNYPHPKAHTAPSAHLRPFYHWTGGAARPRSYPGGVLCDHETEVYCVRDQ